MSDTIDLSQAERDATDPLAKALWETCALIATCPQVPKEFHGLETLSIGFQSVIHQAERHGVTAPMVLESMAKALGCQIAWRAADAQTGDVARFQATQWLNTAYNTAREQMS